MGLFDRFSRKDPTADWPAFSGRAPAITLENLAFGTLRLGDPFENARSIGRPSRFKDGKGGFTLEYDPAGFQLQFRDGKLLCMGFKTEPPAEVKLGGLGLTPKTTIQDVRGWIGEPTSQGGADGLTWVEYARDGATLEFEFDAEEGLGYVQIYAEGYA